MEQFQLVWRIKSKHFHSRIFGCHEEKENRANIIEDIHINELNVSELVHDMSGTLSQMRVNRLIQNSESEYGNRRRKREKERLYEANCCLMAHNTFISLLHCVLAKDLIFFIPHNNSYVSHSHGTFNLLFISLSPPTNPYNNSLFHSFLLFRLS